MNRINKINFVGIAVSAAAMAASSALIAGCGQPPVATRLAPANTAAGTVSMINVPQSLAGIADVSQFNQTQINNLMGNYGGTLQAYDANNNPINQAYTVALTRTTTPQAPGKTFVQASFNSGIWTLASVMQISYQPQGNSAYSSGGTYTFTSFTQAAPTMVQGDPVFFQLELTLNAQNQFDPTQSAINGIQDQYGPCGPFCIVDGVSGQIAATFNGDFARH